MSIESLAVSCSLPRKERDCLLIKPQVAAAGSR